MKRSYIKLFIFNILIVVILLINLLFHNYLSKYSIILFTVLCLTLFHVFFSMEKDREVLLKTVYLESFIYILSFFIIYYLLGLFIGFIKTPNYLEYSAFTDKIIPLILWIVVEEVFRFNMLKKSEGSLFLTIVCVITFIIFDIYSSLFLLEIKTRYEILVFIGIILLPAITNNILYSYVSRQFSYKPVIIIRFIMQLYPYLLPIVPNTNYYISSLILLLFPVLLLIRLYILKEEIDDKELEEINYKKKYTLLISSSIIIMILVYFYSGYFRLHAVAIGSGSMTPNINTGDIVIIYKSKKLDDDLMGKVIAYKNNKSLIVHRIIEKKEKNGETSYITKGDANKNKDNVLIDEKNYYGTIIYRIPYLGLPTVWINELIE